MMLARTIAVALLMLVLGLLANVIVAWSAALWAPMTDSQNPLALTTHEVRRFIDRSPWPHKLRPGRSVSSTSFGLAYDRLESGDDAPHFWHATLAVRAGWPLPAFYGERWINHSADVDPAFRRAFVHAFDPGEFGLDESARPLPYRPVLPGFVTNTVLYAIVLWLLLAMPMSVRGFIRRRRHCCPRCAVPLSTHDMDTCPACHWTRGVTNAHRIE